MPDIYKPLLRNHLHNVGSKMHLPIEQLIVVPRDEIKLNTYRIEHLERYGKIVKSIQEEGQLYPILLYLTTKWNKKKTPRMELLTYNYDGELIIMAGNNKIAAIDKLEMPTVKLKVFTNLDNLRAEQKEQEQWLK